MKYLAYFIFLTLQLSAAQLVLNRYEEQGQSVDIYHLVDTQPISCHEEIAEGFTKRFVCLLSTPVKLDLSIRNDTYFRIYFRENRVIFEAKAYARLLPTDTDLIDKSLIIPPERYLHWTIVGSKKRPDIFTKRQRKKFNFPLRYQKSDPPFVGALDLNGEPVLHNKGAVLLEQIKKLYKEKKYQQVIKLIDSYRSHASGTFSAEIGIYRLRALSALAKKERDNYRLLLEYAKEWLEEFPSNRHVPEVYMYIIQSYLGRGRLKRGEKYLNLLKSGFAQDKYTQRSELIYADTIYKSKKRRNEALSIYKKVLFSAKDLVTASMAAMRIARTYLDFKEPEKAKKHIEKVLKGNPSYITEHPKISYTLANRFANQEHYEIALKIVDLIEPGNDKQLAEELIKNRGYWLEMSGEREKAIDVYNQYLKKYRNGHYSTFVKKHLDALMIMQNDVNQTQKLKFLDQLMDKYQDDDIIARALEEKVKILYSLHRYKEIVAMQEKLKRYKLSHWVKKSAAALVVESLKSEECETAVTLIEDHNVTVERKYDEKLFTCYLKSGKFEQAKKILDENLETEDLKKKLRWLYLAVKYYKSRDENKKVILAGNDILKLGKELGIHKYDDVLYDIANSYYNLREYDDLMLETVKEIEKRFPGDIRNIDIFMKVVRYGQKRKDLLLVINYAKKIIDLQKKHKIDVYSPKIEILYAHELQKIGKYKEALQVVLDLLMHKLTDAQKAEVLYLAGELSLKLGKKDAAIEFYTKCGEIVKDSAWQKLCAENLEILSE